MPPIEGVPEAILSPEPPPPAPKTIPEIPLFLLLPPFPPISPPAGAGAAVIYFDATLNL